MRYASHYGQDLKKARSYTIKKIHADIQFTLEYSKDVHYFPDILIKKLNTKIETDIYYKPTENQKEKRLEELKSFLRYWLCQTSLIEAGIKKLKKWTNKHQDNQNSNQIKEVIPFVTTNNQEIQMFIIMIRSNLPILQNDAKIKKILDNNEIIKSIIQPKSLKHLLTNAKFKDNTTVILNQKFQNVDEQPVVSLGLPCSFSWVCPEVFLSIPGSGLKFVIYPWISPELCYLSLGLH